MLLAVFSSKISVKKTEIHKTGKQIPGCENPLIFFFYFAYTAGSVCVYSVCDFHLIYMVICVFLMAQIHNGF